MLRSGIYVVTKGFCRAARTHLFRLIKRKKALRAPGHRSFAAPFLMPTQKHGKIISEKSFALVSGHWAAHMAGE
jgi:hypothetical protein